MQDVRNRTENRMDLRKEFLNQLTICLLKIAAKELHTQTLDAKVITNWKHSDSPRNDRVWKSVGDHRICVVVSREQLKNN